MWKALIMRFGKCNKSIQLRPGATPVEIKQVEEALSGKLPNDLRCLLSETNGDSEFLMSSQEIIEVNREIRKWDCFMPLDCFIFFGRNGCGDYYGYVIRKDGTIDDNVFMWDHEYDNRTWIANNLEEAISRRYNDEI